MLRDRGRGATPGACSGDYRSPERKIVLATIGTLGDLHPFIALGLALKARGWAPLLAVSESHVGKVSLAGLEAVAIFPGLEEIAESLGLTEAAAVGRVMADQDFMIREFVLRVLADSTERLDAAAQGAAAIVGNIFALAGPIVAEKRDIPFIPAILQPMAIFSAYDPPLGQGYATIAAQWKGPVGRAWNAWFFAILRKEAKRRYGGAIDRVRRAHGLRPMTATPILEPESDRPLRLGLYSPLLAPIQPDFPANVRLVGFPAFDSTTGSQESLDSELETFFGRGPPPLIFTLGSFATYAPGDFYRESRVAARQLGRRAILLTGNADHEVSGDMLVRGYAPHSLVFPRAAAIVHHGGIGTTGQALRSGKPQLVVPHMGDQRDNAGRIARLGVGRVIAARRYTARRAARLLDGLVSDRALAGRAESIGRAIRKEDAAAAAASAVIDAVERAASRQGSVRPSVGSSK